MAIPTGKRNFIQLLAGSNMHIAKILSLTELPPTLKVNTLRQLDFKKSQNFQHSKQSACTDSL
jgi:hypothetical protein